MFGWLKKIVWEFQMTHDFCQQEKIRLLRKAKEQYIASFDEPKNIEQRRQAHRKAWLAERVERSSGVSTRAGGPRQTACDATR